MCKMCWMAATHGVSFRNAWANWVNIEYIVIDLKFIHKFCRFMTLNAKEMVHFVAKCGNNYNFRFQGTFCAPFSRQLFHRLPFHVWTFSQMILSSKRHFSAYVSNKRPPKTLFGHGFLWLRCDSKPLSGHLFAVASVSPWITSCFVQVSHIQVLKCKIPFIIFNVIFAPSISPFLMLRIYAISISCAFLRSGVTWAFAQHPTN